MRYVIRADASPSIGAGHIMRCSAIAEELITRGENVIFVGQISELPWVTTRITSLKFTYTYENPDNFTPDSITDVLIIDSYNIPTDNYFISPLRWRHIIAIVDEETPDYFCELRIHPGLDANWSGTSAVPILAGAKYIPFRSSLCRYVHVPSLSRQLNIAVVAGGSDPYGVVKELAQILSEFDEIFHAHLFSNNIFEFTLDERFSYVEIGPRLDEITTNMDLVLTTSSSSSLEFIAQGLCVGAICAVDNQAQNYQSFHELKIAAQIGFRKSDGTWDIDEKTIHSLVTSSEIRESIRRESKGVFDFQGAARIVSAIKELIDSHNLRQL